jgi:integrase
VGIQRATGDVKGELSRRKEAAAGEERARQRAARLGTFEQLLDSYVQDLRDRGRISARHVETAFARAVKEPFSDLCAIRAKDVTAGDIQQILARLVRRGVRRQVNLVRSYLSAAFQHGTTSDHDPTRLVREGPIFEVALNPVGQVPRKAEFESVGDRHLSAEELRRFWHALDEVDAVPRTFVRFNLCLGGQRAVQLLRAAWPAYDFPNATVLLKDPKGRGGTARDHLVPLTKLALDILAPLRAQNARAAGPFVTRGEQSLHPSTVSKVVTEVWNQLAAEDARSDVENPIPRFVFRDLRRTCETQLAALGVNLETRAQLLSHGRSGVQAKHYDRHTYIAEKRRALSKWAQHLTRVTGSKPARSGVLIDVSHVPPQCAAETA